MTTIAPDLFHSFRTHGFPSWMTFSRSGNATRRNPANGLLEVVGTDVPRLHMTERVVTNLLRRSAEFDNAVWAKTAGVTVTANAGIAPDGSLTASRINGFGDSAGDRVQQNTTITNSTLSGSIYIRGEGSDIGKDVDVVAKRVGGASASGLTKVTLTSEWQRISATFTQLPENTGAGLYLARPASNFAAAPLVWGAQLEAGPYATAYIPTGAATASRTDTKVGYLAEGARTNLLLRSEEFDDAVWAKTRTTIVANSDVAPDGATTMDLLREDATTSQTHFVIQNVTLAASTNYSFSFYAKLGGRTRLRVSCVTADGSCRIIFDLPGKQAINQSSGGALPLTFLSASVVEESPGIYRAALSFTTSTTTANQIEIVLDNGSGSSATSVVYNGDGTSGVYLWGAQLEAGPMPSSYIPTAGTTATRNADFLRITGAPAAALIDNTAQTLWAEFEWVGAGSNVLADSRAVLVIAQNTGNRNLLRNISGQHGSFHNSAAVTQSNRTVATGTIDAGVPSRIASAYAPSSFIAACNGIPSPLGSANTPSLTPDVIGVGCHGYDNGSPAFALITKIAIWKSRLTDPDVTAISTAGWVPNIPQDWHKLHLGIGLSL